VFEPVFANVCPQRAGDTSSNVMLSGRGTPICHSGSTRPSLERDCRYPTFSCLLILVSWESSRQVPFQARVCSLMVNIDGRAASTVCAQTAAPTGKQQYKADGHVLRSGVRRYQHALVLTLSAEIRES